MWRVKARLQLQRGRDQREGGRATLSLTVTDRRHFALQKMCSLQRPNVIKQGGKLVSGANVSLNDQNWQQISPFIDFDSFL